jgi:AcrR family transcriptional regulator
VEKELSQILERAVCLFLKYGIKSISMDDVARELGMSKKTLYQYVQDKNELVNKIIDHEVAKRENMINNPELKAMNAIEATICFTKRINETLKEYSPATEFDLKKYYPDLYKKINDIKKEKIQYVVIRNIKKGKEEGLFRQDVDEEIIAKVHIARIMASANEDLLTLEEYSSAKFMKEMLVYHIRGIATEKGIQVLDDLLKT